jgi:diguanylate cyclase (GGDEF)-like protein
MAAAARLLREQHDGNRAVQCCVDAMVEASDHLALAWLWYGPADTPEIRPQVVAGRAADWARALVIVRDALTERGPAFRTLRGHRDPAVAITEDSPWPPWRQAAREHGIRSVLSLPIASPDGDSGRAGLLVLYADRPDYFSDPLGPLFEPVSELFGALLERLLERLALQQTVLTDELTGLGNRQALRRLGVGLGRQAPQDPERTVLALDLDHLQAVHDDHGHEAGDVVLTGAARALREGVRQSDAVLHLGGGAFVVLLRGADAPRGLRLARQLCHALGTVGHALPDGTRRRVTCSVGVATALGGESLEDTLRRADRALHAAKAAGRDRVEVDG